MKNTVDRVRQLVYEDSLYEFSYAVVTLGDRRWQPFGFSLAAPTSGERTSARYIVCLDDALTV